MQESILISVCSTLFTYEYEGSHIVHKQKHLALSLALELKKFINLVNLNFWYYLLFVKSI